MEKSNVCSIPIVVAKYLSLPSADGFELHDKFAYLIQSIGGDDYYLCDYLVSECLVTEDLGCRVFKTINEASSYKDVFEWYEGWIIE